MYETKAGADAITSSEPESSSSSALITVPENFAEDQEDNIGEDSDNSVEEKSVEDGSVAGTTVIDLSIDNDKE